MLQFQICTNGLVSFRKQYEAYSVPKAGEELADADFTSRYLLCPFFIDITTANVGTILYRKVDTLADESLERDTDLMAVDEIVRSTQNLSDYKSDLVVKVTWDRVGQFGGSSSEVCT